jgi:hypothetical protein
MSPAEYDIFPKPEKTKPESGLKNIFRVHSTCGHGVSEFCKNKTNRAVRGFDGNAYLKVACWQGLTKVKVLRINATSPRVKELL